MLNCDPDFHITFDSTTLEIGLYDSLLYVRSYNIFQQVPKMCIIVKFIMVYWYTNKIHRYSYFHVDTVARITEKD